MVIFWSCVIQYMCTVCHWPNKWPKCVINRLCDNDSNQDNSRPELHNQSVYTLTFTPKHLNQCLTDPGSHIMTLNVYIGRSREQFKEVSVISFRSVQACFLLSLCCMMQEYLQRSEHTRQNHCRELWEGGRKVETVTSLWQFGYARSLFLSFSRQFD